MILKSFTVFYLVIHIFTNFFMTFGELAKVASPITKGFLSGFKQGPPPPPASNKHPASKMPIREIIRLFAKVCFKISQLSIRRSGSFWYCLEYLKSLPETT